MYESVTVLNPAEHAEFRFKAHEDFLFAKDLAVIPITFSELKELCCRFPIVVLPGETPQLAVVVAVEGKNLAIDEHGKWIGGAYVPAFLRRYPFILVKLDEEKLALGADLASGCFSDPSGDPIFDQGKPTEFLQNTMKFLEALEKEFQMTRLIVEGWKEAQILEPAQLTVRGGEEEKKIGGFMRIDREKFTSLDDDLLVSWVRRGIVDLIVLHELSLRNFAAFATHEEKGN